MSKAAGQHRIVTIETVLREHYPSILEKELIEVYNYRGLRKKYPAKKTPNRYAKVYRKCGIIFRKPAGLWRCIERKPGKWKWVHVGQYYDSFSIKAKYEANKNTNCFTDQHLKWLEHSYGRAHVHNNLEILNRIDDSGSGKVITDNERLTLHALAKRSTRNWLVERSINVGARTSFSSHALMVPSNCRVVSISGYLNPGKTSFSPKGRLIVRPVIDNIVQVESHQAINVDNKAFFSAKLRVPLFVPANSLLNISVTNEGSNAAGTQLLVSMFMEEHDE